jgi:hypothetical protein
MNSLCLICGGLTLEPNTAYGYTGKVCCCPKQSTYFAFPSYYPPPTLQEKAQSLVDLLQAIQKELKEKESSTDGKELRTTIDSIMKKITKGLE